jgi:spermidine/putrescine transport system ATP-binding protein
MTGKLRARFGGGEYECVDDVAQGTHITAVVRPEDIEITRPDQGIVRGPVISVIFKGMHYEITVQAGKNEYVIRDVRNAVVGSLVGLRVDPDNIHIMVSEDAVNIFPVDINRNYRLEYNGVVIDTSVTGIIRGSRRLEDGTLVDVHGDVVNLDRVHVVAAIRPEDIEMTDEQDVGLTQGNITNLIYLGDHYSYVVHTDHDQDFVVNDEDLWNMGDRVSLLMPVEKMTFTYSRKK